MEAEAIQRIFIEQQDEGFTPIEDLSPWSYNSAASLTSRFGFIWSSGDTQLPTATVTELASDLPAINPLIESSGDNQQWSYDTLLFSHTFLNQSLQLAQATTRFIDGSEFYLQQDSEEQETEEQETEETEPQEQSE